MHNDAASFCWENISAVFLPRKQQFGFALGFAQRAEGVWQKPRLISASSTSSSSLPRSICQKKLVKHDRFLKLEIKRVFGKKNRSNPSIIIINRRRRGRWCRRGMNMQPDSSLMNVCSSNESFTCSRLLNIGLLKPLTSFVILTILSWAWWRVLSLSWSPSSSLIPIWLSFYSLICLIMFTINLIYWPS